MEHNGISFLRISMSNKKTKPLYREKKHPYFLECLHREHNKFFTPQRRNEACNLQPPRRRIRRLRTTTLDFFTNDVPQ